MANDVEVVANVAEKRPLDTKEDENGVQPSRKKLKNDGKNAIAILNDLRRGLKYEVLDTEGPPHAPTFTMAVTVDNQQYVGTGRSKKIAKCKAAQTALTAFIQFPDNLKVLSPNSSTSSKLDFTSDAFDSSQNNAIENEGENKPKNELMLLNELYPSAKYTCVENVNDTFAKFKITIDVNGSTFIGTGPNKKMAKRAAAKSALSKLLTQDSSVPIFRKCGFKPKMTYEEQEWADNAGRLVTEKFNALMVNDTLHAKRKVLAGIVMSKGRQLEVISVSTGTKCVSGERMSLSGANLNDMHAEIISRRCLELFLFDQLLMLSKPDKAEESIFEAKADGAGYKLKDEIDFHLYINTAPCGDARIFSPYENTTLADPHPNRNSRGRLRAKIESGEGTIPVKNLDSIQTWDGIIQGARLVTMSCSDKIARWNVLGVQGALLAHFIEPIYLKTIILGSLFHESHLYRAICGRIDGSLQGLPPPYRLNKPKMCLVTSSEARHPSKVPNFSVNWTIGQETFEVNNTAFGKPERGVSRVCKQIFAQKFTELCNSGLKWTTDIDLVNAIECYSDAKEQSLTYKAAKERFFEALSRAGLGRWIQKPLEQDQFIINLKDTKTEIKSETD